MPAAIRICARYVVSEVIDDEAVIMDLRSGNYFSATGAGAAIWGLLEAGRSRPEIMGALQGRYLIDRSSLDVELERFYGELLAHQLVEEMPADLTHVAQPTHASDAGPAAASGTEPFEPPRLAMHTDMQDLLLLDPIHDVDAAGWPVRKA